MKICDFCSTAKILMDFIGESKNINQIDFMYELFKDFMESDEAKDFDFDNGLVCRWLNGTAKLSPKITAYYSALGNLEAMAIDIEENILPLFYDKDMAVTELYDLLLKQKSKSLQTIIHTKMMLIYQTSLVSLSFLEWKGNS